MKQKFFRLWPSLIWMGVIFYFSSKSTAAVPLTGGWRFLFFKSLHLIEYAILAICLGWALIKRKNIIIIGYLYALSDEIHQFFVPGRESRFQDTLVDLIGIFLGIFLFKFLNQFWIARK